MRRLGVNIDHIATLRNARGEKHPDLLKAAKLITSYGADSITLHLREDRRHIKDSDVAKICKQKKISVNLEKAIYNYTLKEASSVKELKKWNNPFFVQIYTNHFKSILINLNK